MTLMRRLTPELEHRLRTEADRRGLAADEYARALLEERLILASSTAAMEPLRPGQSQGLTPEEWDQRFDALSESFEDVPTPDFPDDWLRREHLYEDRGL